MAVEQDLASTNASQMLSLNYMRKLLHFDIALTLSTYDVLCLRERPGGAVFVLMIDVNIFQRGTLANARFHRHLYVRLQQSCCRRRMSDCRSAVLVLDVPPSS